MRDGRVPKLQKNFDKLQQERLDRQRKAEGWLEEQARKERFAKPLKIKASSYGRDAVT